MTHLIRGWTKHLTPPVPGWQRTDPLDRGLVGEWRFDPVTGLLLPDYSGYGSHGAVVNNPTWAATRYGPALRFPGTNEYVNIDTLANHLNCSEGTICIFATRSFADGVIDHHLFGSRVDAQNRIRFYYLAGQNKIRFSYEANNVDKIVGVNATTYMPRYQWCHHVGTWSASLDETAYYIDGVQLGTTDTLGAWAGVPLRTSIASAHDGGIVWAGDVAFVRAYNRALTAAEVRARYQICLKRAQPMTHVWMTPWGMAPVAPPVGGHMTLWGRYWGP